MEYLPVEAFIKVAPLPSWSGLREQHSQSDGDFKAWLVKKYRDGSWITVEDVEAAAKMALDRPIIPELDDFPGIVKHLIDESRVAKPRGDDRPDSQGHERT